MDNLEHEQETDQEYIDSYNAGYLIGKYSPEIRDLLVPVKGDGQKFEAFTSGMEQYSLEEANKTAIEKPKDNLPDFLKKHGSDRTSSNEREPDRDIEPER
jgi:hypothetical protein